MPASTRRLASSCLLPSLALAGLLTGCSAARMQLDPQLTAYAPDMQVSGLAWVQFRKPITFGNYTAALTRGGWKTSTKTQAGPYSASSTKQDFDFTMSGGTPASWAGTCTYGTSQRSVLFPINDDAGLVCTLVPQGAGGWQIALASKGNLTAPNTLSGTLTDGTTTYGVAMVHRLANSAFNSATPVGYEIRDAAGVAVAAIQVFNPGHVWIDARLAPEQQTALAASAAALLMSAGATSEINDQK